MVTSNHLTPGMTITISGKLFRVETSMKVSVSKGTSFIKAQLRELGTSKIVEKNFKLNQTLKEVALKERHLEFLYLEGKDYLFLDLDELEQVLVSPEVVGDSSEFLKEGSEATASFYEEKICAVELPQFLELMISKTEEAKGKMSMTNGTKKAVLETGATVEVPLFIETGDVIKVDTKNREYIQRV